MQLREPPRASGPKSVDRFGRALLLLIVVLLIGLGAWLMLQPAGGVIDAEEADRQRRVAARLQSAGALEEAARLYESYLGRPHLATEQRARIAFSLGESYLETGRYESALRWFYEAETLGVGDLLADELASRIVHCLERLGRHHAAQAALERSAALDPAGNSEERSPEDPIVARFGDTEVRRSEVLRSIDSLPPEIASTLASTQGKQELLRKYVADELLWRRAVKLEYDRDPEIEQRLEEMRRQLVITRFVEQEVLAQIEIDESDLRNFFAANRDRYQSTDAEAPQVTFEQVRAIVESDYRMSKVQAAYQQWIDTELSTQQVELFPERMADEP